jgi:virulence factor Mce-like protein
VTRSRRQRSLRRNSLRLYATTGIIGIVVGLAIVCISYTANGGLPFAKTYRMYVELPNAQRLQRGSDVRIGGIRVGQVQAVSATRESGDGRVPFARLELSLSPSVGHIPVNSHVQEQPASILGASYLQLTLGTSRNRLGSGGTLALSQSTPTVQLTDLLDIFNRATAHSIQSSLGDFSSGLAGRGGDLNATIASFSQLLPSLQDVSATLASSQANLGRFIDGLDATSTAFAPVAGSLRALFGEAATAFQAFRGDGRALGSSLDQLPGTEAITTTALQRVDPALAGATQLARELVPGARLVRNDVPQLTSALHAGTDSLGQIQPLTADLQDTLRALRTLSRDPATTGSFKVLSQATAALKTALDVIAPAQLQCNVIPLWGRNVTDSAQQGTSEFPFVPLGVVGTGADNEYAQHATPSDNLHVDYLPHENDHECESGNEPYSATSQDLTSPPGNQPNHTQLTSPPGGVHQLAARAGLLGTGGTR